jgi:hypothetical protein
MWSHSRICFVMNVRHSAPAHCTMSSVIPMHGTSSS